MHDWKIYKALRPLVDVLTGAEGEQWVRKAADLQILQLVSGLKPERFSALEISGRNWEKRVAFRSYASYDFPEHDICAGPPPGTYDFIVAEHVFEHLLYPYRAARNVLSALNPGGYFLMATPFMVGLHPCPHDCTRWTEEGAKYFLSEAGFPLDLIQTGSWGNRKCIKGNFKRAIRYRRRLHSLKNEPNMPVTVWTLARKAGRLPGEASADPAGR
jgi:SAM-dependent methyltransferase